MRQIRQPNPVVGWAVVVASVIALALTASAGIQQRRQAQCQQRVNDRLIATLHERGVASSADWAALDKLVLDIADAPDEKARNELRRQYVSTRAAADERRRANPIPAPASSTCD